MELLLSVLGGALLEIGKCLCGCMYPRIKSAIRFQSSLANLRKEMENLVNLRNNVVEGAQNDGHPLTVAVTEWIGEVQQIETEVNSMQASMTSNAESMCKCCPDCFLRCTLGVEVAKKHIEVQRLIKAGSFTSGLVVKNYLVKKVEHIPGTSIESQSTTSSNLAKVLNLLNDDAVSRIGIWGMGGVGKTTLVKNLNNKLEIASSTTQPFSIVIWVTVSKELNLKNVQTQIVERLKLGVRTGESMERTAYRLYQRLVQEKKFLLILDDVWKKIDLDCLGVPQPEVHKGCKLILTSRFLDVCRKMRTDAEVKVDTLNEEESWQLFAHNAGEVVSLQHIKPFAKAVSRECSGLPLAIIAVGASMRGKTMIELWKDALNALQRSIPHINGIEDEVYKPLKWSYDSLQDMEIKSCFLYCCLYPEDFSIEVTELVQCWVAEGLTDELQSYEDSINRGIATVENLKDCCLLEHGDYEGFVKMHDVVRDVAVWIATSLEDGCKSMVRSGIGLNDISEVALLKSVKRVSFMQNKLTTLPESVMQYPEASTLLLPGNFHLEIVPEGFLLGFPVLRVLNLSVTGIKELPLSLNRLGKLRALLLRGCQNLKKLPPVGGLRRLQVLDCSHTAIEELPEGMEKLTNLRQLDLSETHSFKSIQVGIVSRLSRLEVIDMTESAYNWGEIEFKELQCLDQLSVLYISLALSYSVDLSWIERLKRFHFLIGITYSRSRMPGKYDERRVTMSFYPKYGGWIVGLLNNAESLHLERCYLEDLNKFLVKDSCFHGLKSLHISTCWISFERARGSAPHFGIIPNLEELVVHGMDQLKTISELVGHLGLGLSKLRVIEVSNCKSLNYLLSVGGSLPTLKNLEEVTVRCCEKLTALFDYYDFSRQSSTSSSEEFEENVGYDSSRQTSVPDPINLRAVKLHFLPNLNTLSRQEESWQRLQQLEVSSCQLIKKLPLTTQNENSIKEIRGESQWWSKLEWDDEHTKSSLQQYFTPLTTKVLALEHLQSLRGKNLFLNSLRSKNFIFTKS